MATLSITVPDAVVPRIKTAMGHWDNTVIPAVWIDATLTDVQVAIKAFIKSQVINYETTQAAIAKNAAVSGESW